MINRMMVALGTVLLLGGSTLAQAPDTKVPDVEAPAPPSLAASGNLDILPVAWEPNPRPNEPIMWATMEYLLGWFQGDKLQALVTTSPAGTARDIAGIPGFPSTTTLFGGGSINDEVRSGLRLIAGFWFTPERILGAEAGFMIVESQAAVFSATSDGTTILARPFINSLTNVPEAAFVAIPSSSSIPGSAGTVTAHASSGNFYEAHLDLTEKITDLGWVRLDTLLGYRFYRYDEGLIIQQTLFPFQRAVTGTKIVNSDNFQTKNEFNGGDFGMRAEFVLGDLSLGILGKLGVGDVHREVDIQGSQVVIVPTTAPVVRTGSLYALSSNIGLHGDDDWTLLPEFGLNLGWQATSNLRVTLGYSVLWLNRIARASDQIDMMVNPNLFPPATSTPTTTDHPAYSRNRADVWLQCLNFGVELTY